MQPTTLACQLGDYPDWHKGRTHYGVWIVEVEQPPVLQRLEQMRLTLKDELHPQGLRQAHITVFVNGFISATPLYDDDFSHIQLDQQIKAVKALNLKPFELILGRASSFSSAAYVEVNLPHALTCLREALAKSVNEVRQSPYTPHLTAGLYAKQAPMQRIAQRLAQIPKTPLPLPVSSVCFATYQAHDQQGELSIEQRIRFL